MVATGVTGSLAGCASLAGGFGGSGSSDDDPPATTKQNETDTTTAQTTENATSSEESGTSTETDVQISEPDVFSSSVPTPATPSDSTFATMGAAVDRPTATVYGNWKCPYTQEFVLTLFGDLVEEFVASGDLAIEFRSVAYENDDPFLGPDAPRAARAGLAAWNVDPDAYWEYFAYVFENQPPERDAWAQPELLGRFASEADLASVDEFEEQLDASDYEEPVQATASQFQELGASAVPRVVTDDEVTAPNLDPERTRDQLRRLTESGN